MLTIDSLAPRDLPATAALHKAHLHLGLFPRLGRHFLGEYQETFARSPYGIALVAHDGDRVVGALFGTSANAEHYRWVVRHCGIELALAGAGAMLLRPQLAWTFASTRLGRYARGLGRHLGAPAPPAGRAGSGAISVLSHIVTDAAERRRGVGRLLVEHFRELATADGARRARLVTADGGMGMRFFEALGCRCVSCRAGPDGSLIREYRLLLDEDEHEGNATRRRLAAASAGRPGSGAPDWSPGPVRVH